MRITKKKKKKTNVGFQYLLQKLHISYSHHIPIPFNGNLFYKTSINFWVKTHK